ncbi:MAG: cadmium-translocating P-type ATPase [Treponema sp.]|nr:cadmium-translocating P-type ATPase [Treponema sp.]
MGHCCCHEDIENECENSHSHGEHSHEDHSHGEHSHGEHSFLLIIVAGVFFLLGIISEKIDFAFFGSIEVGLFSRKTVSLFFYFVAYILCAKEIVINAFKNIFKGSIFDEQFLMALASLGAIAIGEYAESIAVVLLYQIGEFAQDKAVSKSRSAIKTLMQLKPAKTFVKENESFIEKNVCDVKVGDIVLVKPGEKIPLDGIVEKGQAFIDTSFLTGESRARKVLPGEEVFSGTVNVDGVLEMQVTKCEKDSSVARIIELVEHSQKKKAHTEQFITRFAKIYTPIVCLCALALAFIPSLITGDTKTWIYRSLIFLVVSCPCALVISVPLSFFSGIGVASKNGILLKGSEVLEKLSKAKIAAFDKTGTLTHGEFAVNDVELLPNAKITQEEILTLASHAESFSNHPIAKSIREMHTCKDCSSINVSDLKEIAGMGISACVDKKNVLLGNEKLMLQKNVNNFLPCKKNGTIVYVALENEYQGCIIICDKIKLDAKNAIQKIRQSGVQKIAMLTGDSKEVADVVAKELGVDTVFAELLPDGKVQKIEELLSTLGNAPLQKRGTLLFAGDGINDSPVIARSDVGIAMGSKGSDAAIVASDAVIMSDEVSKIASAITISKKTVKIVRQNIAFSLIAKFCILILGALGFANMWTAVFGDTGVALLAVTNSLRIMKYRKKE